MGWGECYEDFLNVERFSRTQVFEWFSKPKISVALVEDAECSGHPLTSKTHENLDQVKEHVLKKR